MEQTKPKPKPKPAKRHNNPINNNCSSFSGTLFSSLSSLLSRRVLSVQVLSEWRLCCVVECPLRPVSGWFYFLGRQLAVLVNRSIYIYIGIHDKWTRLKLSRDAIFHFPTISEGAVDTARCRYESCTRYTTIRRYARTKQQFCTASSSSIIYMLL